MTGHDSVEALVVWLLDHPGLEVPDIDLLPIPEPPEEEEEDVPPQPAKPMKPEVVSQEDSDYDISSQSSEDSDPFEFELPGTCIGVRAHTHTHLHTCTHSHALVHTHTTYTLFCLLCDFRTEGRRIYKTRAQFRDTDEYGEYVKANIQPGMTVRCWVWYEEVKKGDIGRVIKVRVQYVTIIKQGTEII